MVVPINWMMISHLCIGNMRTKKFTKLPETHPLEKDGRIVGFQVFQAGQGFKVWAVTEIGFPLPGSARPRWCHGGWDLADSGAEARVFSIWISRWVVELISIDGWFSCSKTTDSDFQFHKQGEANRTFKCSGKKTTWDSSLFGFGSLDVLQKPILDFWSVKISGWLGPSKIGLRDFVVQQNTDSDSWMSLPTQKWDVSITSNLKTWAPRFLLILTFFFFGYSRWGWVCARTWWSIWWSEGGDFSAPERCRRVEVRLCSFGSLDVLIWL